MMLALIAALAVAPSASDFFPLTPNRRMIYEASDRVRTLSADTVGTPVKIGDTMATPVRTESGIDSSNTYYVVSRDSVLIVAYDPKVPLPEPIPILRVAAGPTTWTFSGRIEVGSQGEVMRMSGASRLIGKQKVLGREVEILEVRLTSQVGAEGPIRRTEQTALYGKGIGLVELTTRDGITTPVTTRIRLKSIEKLEPIGR